MKLTKSRLKQIIQEVAQKEGLRDFVKGVFSEPEEKTTFQRVLHNLQMDHNMYISANHPLYTILQKSDEADLELLDSRLEQPYGAAAPTLQEDMMDAKVWEAFAQVLQNFSPATYPALAGLAVMSGKEIVDKIKQHIDPVDTRGIMKDPEHRA